MHRKVRVGFHGGICVMRGHNFKEHAVNLVLYWWQRFKVYLQSYYYYLLPGIIVTVLGQWFWNVVFTRVLQSLSKSGCESISQESHTTSWHGCCVWKTSEIINSLFSAVGGLSLGLLQLRKKSNHLGKFKEHHQTLSLWKGALVFVVDKN